MSISLLIGSFGLSTKEPYTVMLCPSLASSALVSSASSVHTSPWHMVRHRNFIFGIHMHICPPHVQIKYLVILTCSFLNGSHFGNFLLYALLSIWIGIETSSLT